MTAIDLIAIGLATFRLVSLLQGERGPFAIFERMRGWVALRDGVPVEEQRLRHEVALALACSWCLSLWAALACWGLWLLEPWIVVIMAASTIAIVADRYLED